MFKKGQNPKASAWWYLWGMAGGIGNVIAAVYVLLSASKKKLYALFFLIGFFGPLLVYFATKEDDAKLADLSKKLAIGNAVAFIIAIVLLILYLLLIVAIVKTL